MKLANVKHIAIFNTAFLGDITLSLFLCKKIKDISPNTRITFITTKEASTIIDLSENVDNVLVFDKRNQHKKISKVMQFAKELNNLNIDCFISTHKSFRSGLLLYAIKATKICFNDANLSAFAQYRVPYRLYLHEVKRQLSLLLPFSEFQEIDFDNYNFPNLKLNAESNKLKQTICIAPGSVWKTKRWTASGFAIVIDYFAPNYRICLIGGKDESVLSNDIENLTKDKFENLVGQLSFKETIELISNSSMMLSNDSAPTHFASITNTKTLTIYGPTSPKFGFAPIANNSSTISLNLPCSPCHHHGLNTCPIKHHNCMEKLQAAEVIAKMEQLLLQQT